RKIAALTEQGNAGLLKFRALIVCQWSPLYAKPTESQCSCFRSGKFLRAIEIQRQSIPRPIALPCRAITTKIYGGCTNNPMLSLRSNTQYGVGPPRRW